VKQMNDNAFIESFFQQFKTERIKRVVVKTAEQLRVRWSNRSVQPS